MKKESLLRKGESAWPPPYPNEKADAKPWTNKPIAKSRGKPVARNDGSRTGFYDKVHEYVDELAYMHSTSKRRAHVKPNSTIKIDDNLPELLLSLGIDAIKIYLRCLTLLKRNKDSALACTIILKYEDVEDIVKRRSYFKAIKVLQRSGLIFKENRSNVALIKVEYANVLFAPKAVK